MRLLLAIVPTVGLTLAAPAQAARFPFCWFGASGYTMQGVIGFPDALLNTGIITQDDVTEFAIAGFLDGVPVGSWSLDQLMPDTTWELYFDTTKLEFPTGGFSAQASYQAWNANGQVDDCGVDGFGFNGGNYAQDVCIDNVWIEASSIDPDTPFPVLPDGTALRCDTSLPVS